MEKDLKNDKKNDSKSELKKDLKSDKPKRKYTKKIKEPNNTNILTALPEKKEIEDNFLEIINSSILKDSTKKIYNDTYKKLITNEKYKNGVVKLNEDEIIESLKNLVINDKKISNPSSLNSYLNVIFLIFKHHNLDNKKLFEFKSNNNTERIKTTMKNSEKKGDELVNYKELLEEYLKIEEKAKEQIKDKNPIKTFLIKYIVNYILFNFFVRNQDIDIYITNDINEINKRTEDSKKYENTIFIDEKEKNVIYRRYKYKTFSSYGSKIHLINDELFYNCCLKLNNSYLLQKTNGEKISDSSLNKTVMRISTMTIGEGNIFKILLDRSFKQKKPTKEIKKMFDMRGSSLENFFNYYDLAKDNINYEEDFLSDVHKKNILIV
jgi:hypothetical protein